MPPPSADTVTKALDDGDYDKAKDQLKDLMDEAVKALEAATDKGQRCETIAPERDSSDDGKDDEKGGKNDEYYIELDKFKECCEAYGKADSEFRVAVEHIRKRWDKWDDEKRSSDRVGLKDATNKCVGEWNSSKGDRKELNEAAANLEAKARKSGSDDAAKAIADGLNDYLGNSSSEEEELE